jgi:hypothetical protein
MGNFDQAKKTREAWALGISFMERQLLPRYHSLKALPGRTLDRHRRVSQLVNSNANSWKEQTIL